MRPHRTPLSVSYLAAAVALTIALSATLIFARAGGRQTDRQTGPVFTAGVDVVRLGVRVVDKNHQPIRGLTADDFSVWVDDVAQPVVAVSEVDASDLAPAGPSWARDVTPDVVTNEGADRRQRLWALLIDDCSLRLDPFELHTTKTIARGIVTNMGPTDKAAVFFTWDNAGAQDFTTNRERLFTAIETTAPPPPGAPCRAERNIQDAWEFLDALDNPRAGLVYIGRPPGAVRPTEALPKQITSGEVPFFGLSVSGLVTPDSSAPRGRQWMQVDATNRGSNFLRFLSDQSGGAAVVDTNAPDRAVPEMFAETATTYVVGYRQTYPVDDGHERRLKIRVRRPGAVVLPPDHGFVSTRPPDPSKPVAPWMSLANALAGLLPDSHSPIRVNLLPMAPASNGAGQDKETVALAVGVSLGPVNLKPSDHPVVQIETIVFDAEGRKEILSETQRIDVTGAAREYDVLSTLALKPGRYNVRCAAVSEMLGLEGSTCADVIVLDVSRAPIAVSGLALTATPRPVATPYGALAHLLPIVPTTRREFVPADRVTAFLRVYQAVAKPAAAVNLHVRIEETVATLSTTPRRFCRRRHSRRPTRRTGREACRSRGSRRGSI